MSDLVQDNLRKTLVIDLGAFRRILPTSLPQGKEEDRHA